MSLAERFWRRVEKGGGCWLWPRSNPNGYATVYADSTAGRKRFSYAHRIAWELTHGPIPRTKIVCHRCDNRRCVRPDHLFLGSYRDNTLDMMRKGRDRHGTLRGEQHGRALLTAEDVRSIRARYSGGESQTQLSAAYGVTQTQISRIVLLHSWKHIV